MCNTCCKEVHGWCRAFTVTEVLLCILEAILLFFFISFLTFLILHLIACTDSVAQIKTETGNTISSIGPEEINSSEVVPYSEPAHTQSNLPQDIECTWTPSEKTRTSTQYFEYSRNQNITVAFKKPEDNLTTLKMWPSNGPDDLIMTLPFGPSDSEIADDKKSFVMIAITSVKMMSPHNMTFGCILTIVSKFWTVTAASCIESIKDIDTLNALIMIDNFGELAHSRTHGVEEMIVHPKYQSTNKTYDIAMLRSANNLATYRDKLVQLPTMIDYFLIAIGEKLSILGFGNFRSSNKHPITGNVNEVVVHMLPSRQCDTLNLPLSSFMICAGVLYSRRTPCNYCAGTPLLLRGAVLVGIMSGNGRCDTSCDLALYVNIALVSDWINSVIEHD